ncbi:MAG: ATP phosphoribosyltransferase, partial [Oscillospiraceae bacterium]|nr:ATP phosphoribosyltransferase [Candidatus Equicaccousia limihippi]
MKINDAVLQNYEKVAISLRELYLSYGFAPYRMSKFEEYDLYAKNKDFLVSDNVITFNDTDGKLLALKPDVTLSIIKNSIDDPTVTKKVFYNENVYRVQKAGEPFKEIMQTGVETFGYIDLKEICNTITIAAKSLELLSPDSVLAVSDLGVISGLVDALGLDEITKQAVYKAVGERNIREITDLCENSENKNALLVLTELISVHGTAAQVLSQIEDILKDTPNDFVPLLKELAALKLSSDICVDFSVTGDYNYYNGIVFKGFIKDIPTEVLSGGRYDKLMHKMGRKSSAVGFAVYTGIFDRLDLSDSKSADNDNFINIALPKGRLGEKIYDMFAKAGYECPSILEPNRKLIFENPKNGVRYFWVKPSDVPIYVERGAADIGVAGKDILLEYEPDVYELLDLKKGKCRMAVAAPKDY